MEKYKINIATDFSEKLGGRWVNLGPYSGEQFYNELLLSKYEEAEKAGEQLHIYLDGASPYGSSFLDQSFGELVRTHDKEKVVATICFHTTFYKWIENFIKSEIWK